ncbi:MAG: tRNA (N6-threonylcarbamoyladenosine(37)-N6)-methyltransferase TrmO [Thiotrichales bacterium]
MVPIGFIDTCYTTLADMPIQPKGAQESIGIIELRDSLRAGLKSLDGFSHIYLIYLFHRAEGYDLTVKPFMDDKYHSVFATRAPRRPNPLGLSLVRLLSVEENTVKVAGADLLDGTPILDIKPYMEQFDAVSMFAMAG